VTWRRVHSLYYEDKTANDFTEYPVSSTHVSTSRSSLNKIFQICHVSPAKFPVLHQFRQECRRLFSPSLFFKQSPVLSFPVLSMIAHHTNMI
jgi:hypothetical protein